MDIFDKCEDPQESVFGRMKCPSNTPYPPGTICAIDFARQACFSPGESGSPLMIQEGKGKDDQEDYCIKDDQDDLDDQDDQDDQDDVDDQDDPDDQEDYCDQGNQDNQDDQVDQDKKNNTKRFYAEGILSFVKGRGCDVYSNNPSAYTKLSCFLPWIAREYGMDYDPPSEDDPQCTRGTAGSISQKSECLDHKKLSKPTEKCQNIPSNLQEFLVGEQDCIFPFYYNGKKYDHCIVFTEGDFVYPAFRCPVHNVTTKKKDDNGKMINDFTIKINASATDAQNKDCPSFACQIFQTPLYCAKNATDPFSDLDPNMQCGIAEKRAPFSVCKNNCPGVNVLGVIGGGALAFAATATLGQSLLVPAMGLGIPAAGLAGMGLMMQNQCPARMCRAQSGQCCTFTGFEGNLRCPSRC
jgi:hypothetical protein